MLIHKFLLLHNPEGQLEFGHWIRMNLFSR